MFKGKRGRGASSQIILLSARVENHGARLPEFKAWFTDHPYQPLPSLLELQNLRTRPNLGNQNLHFHKISRAFTGRLKFEEAGPSDQKGSWGVSSQSHIYSL